MQGNEILCNFEKKLTNLSGCGPEPLLEGLSVCEPDLVHRLQLKVAEELVLGQQGHGHGGWRVGGGRPQFLRIQRGKLDDSP